jgi:hypothetical protein
MHEISIKLEQGINYALSCLTPHRPNSGKDLELSWALEAILDSLPLP